MAARIYLDHAATTPVLPAALAAQAAGMLAWANPSSPHAEGRRARAMLEDARGRIAAALGWDGHVLLTSGASEAIALAVARAKVGAVEASPFEHDAVGRAVKSLSHRHSRESGNPGPRAIHPENLGSRFRGNDRKSEGLLIARQTVNSETGIILDPPESGPLWLADTSQSAGKLPLPAADFCIVSGHKLGAPPGLGALLVRDLASLEPSGGQEQGYRGGTENLPGALALAAALEAPRNWLDEAARLRAMLDAAVTDGGGEIVGGDRPRLATIAAYRLPGMAAAAQLIRLDMAGIAVSAGSACSSGTLRSSPVLRALGLDDRTASEVIRVSFGWPTTEDEVARFAEAWTKMARAR